MKKLLIFFLCFISYGIFGQELPIYNGFIDAIDKISWKNVPKRELYGAELLDQEGKVLSYIEKYQNWISLSDFNVKIFSQQTYQLRVRTKLSGNWQDYGNARSYRTICVAAPILDKPIYYQCPPSAFYGDKQIVAFSTNTSDRAYWYAVSDSSKLLSNSNAFFPRTAPEMERVNYMVNNSNGGVLSKTHFFEVNYERPIYINIQGNTEVEEGEAIQLRAYPNEDAYQVVWFAKGQKYIGATLNITSAQYSDNGVYGVVILDKKTGCQYTDNVCIRVRRPVKDLPIVPQVSIAVDSSIVTCQDVLDEYSHRSTDKGHLYFSFTEKYMIGRLNCKVYDWKHQEIARVNLQKKVGQNSYGLDFYGLCENGQTYTMEVFNEKGYRQVLKFLYQYIEPLKANFIIANACEGYPALGEVYIEGGYVPYKVEVYIASNNKDPFLESADLVKTTQDQKLFFYTDRLEKAKNNYYAGIIVTDARGNKVKLNAKMFRTNSPSVCPKKPIVASTPTTLVEIQNTVTPLIWISPPNTNTNLNVVEPIKYVD